MSEKKKRKQTRRCVSVETPTYDRLKALAAERGCSMSGIVEAELNAIMDKAETPAPKPLTLSPDVTLNMVVKR